MADQQSGRFKILRMEPPENKRSVEFDRMLNAMKDFYADMREELDILNARTDKLVTKVALLSEAVKKLSRK
jgi:archaellum component FlaC